MHPNNAHGVDPQVAAGDNSIAGSPRPRAMHRTELCCMRGQCESTSADLFEQGGDTLGRAFHMICQFGETRAGS